MYCIINNYQLCDILYYLIKYIVTNKQPPTNKPNLTDKQLNFWRPSDSFSRWFRSSSGDHNSEFGNNRTNDLHRCWHQPQYDHRIKTMATEILSCPEKKKPITSTIYSPLQFSISVVNKSQIINNQFQSKLNLFNCYLIALFIFSFSQNQLFSMAGGRQRIRVLPHFFLISRR